VSKRQAKGEERYVVRVVCVDPKKEFGKMATGQQQLPKKPNISFSVTIKEGPLTEERSRDIVQLVLEKLPGGPLSENDVVKLGCKSLKRGNIIAEIDAIDESTDEDGGEAARSAWSDVSAFFVQRFGEAGAKIHKLEELRESEGLKEGSGGKVGRAQKGEEEKDLNKSMHAGSTSAAKDGNLNKHHEKWGGGVSGKLAYGGHVDQVFTPTYGGNVDQVCDPVFFPGNTFDEASSDELSDGGALSTQPCKVCGWRRRLVAEDRRKQSKRRGGWACGDYALDCMTDDRVFVTTLFLRLNPKSTVADARPKRKMPGPNAARTARKKPRIMKPRKLSIRLVSPMLLVDSQGPQNLRFVPCATNPVTSFLVEAEELEGDLVEEEAGVLVHNLL
jgi:hypothetical protein